jgi:hypothetical protein
VRPAAPLANPVHVKVEDLGWSGWLRVLVFVVQSVPNQLFNVFGVDEQWSMQCRGGNWSNGLPDEINCEGRSCYCSMARVSMLFTSMSDVALTDALCHARVLVPDFHDLFLPSERELVDLLLGHELGRGRSTHGREDDAIGTQSHGEVARRAGRLTYSTSVVFPPKIKSATSACHLAASPSDRFTGRYIGYLRGSACMRNRTKDASSALRDEDMIPIQVCNGHFLRREWLSRDFYGRRERVYTQEAEQGLKR